MRLEEWSWVGGIVGAVAGVLAVVVGFVGWLVKPEKAKAFFKRHSGLIVAGFVVAVLLVARWLGWLSNHSRQHEEASPAITPIRVSQLPEQSGSNHSETSISVKLVPGVTFTNYETVLVGLRNSRNLREITTLESGKPVSDMPAETYYFVDGIDFAVYGYRDPSTTARRYLRDAYREYEIHNLADGTVVLNAFTSESEAASISHLSGTESKSVVLFPYATHSQPTLVSIPVGRITACSGRQVNVNDSHDAYVLDMTLK